MIRTLLPQLVVTPDWYVGNDYERRVDTQRFLVRAAEDGVRVDVYGKWHDPLRPDLLQYHGRVGYAAIASIYRGVVATVALAPARYKRTGQFTQRLHESLAHGCLPLVPSDHRGATEVAVPELVVADGSVIQERLAILADLDDKRFTMLVAAQRLRLSRFSVTAILQAVVDAVEGRLPRFEGCVPGWKP
jgi:hypothetical protein